MNGRSFSDLESGPGPSGPWSDLIAVNGGAAAYNILTALSQRGPSGDVPVPATIVLLALGLVGIGAARRKQS